MKIAPAVVSLLTLFTGFLIKSNDIPNYFIWVYYINPTSYFLQGALAFRAEAIAIYVYMYRH